jgi:hypothetical protein
MAVGPDATRGRRAFAIDEPIQSLASFNVRAETKQQHANTSERIQRD